MDIGKIVLGLGSLIGIGYLVSKFAGGAKTALIGDYTISQPGIRILDAWSAGKLKCQVRAVLTRTSGAVVTMQDFNGGLYYGKEFLADLKLSPDSFDGGTRVLQLNKPLLLVFDVNINYLKLVGAVGNLADTGNWINNLYIKGDFITPDFKLPIEKTVQLWQSQDRVLLIPNKPLENETHGAKPINTVGKSLVRFANKQASENY